MPARRADDREDHLELRGRQICEPCGHRPQLYGGLARVGRVLKGWPRIPARSAESPLATMYVQ